MCAIIYIINQTISAIYICDKFSINLRLPDAGNTWVQ